MSLLHRLVSVVGAVAVALSVCGCGGSHPGPQPRPPAPSTCGTRGGGRQVTVNHPGYYCTNCGYRPCVSTSGTCYSCAGIDGRCYAYDCGTHCSASPCSADYSTCGTKGGGDRICVNNPHYTCYNCGQAPCVDVRGYCYSCYSRTGGSRCYKYACHGGLTCSNGPCDMKDAEFVPASPPPSALAANGTSLRQVPAHWVPKMKPNTSEIDMSEEEGSAEALPEEIQMAVNTSAPAWQLRAVGAAAQELDVPLAV
mmetsp:Transcript_9264/g.21746  ORF Transcript_9264/g.21746 Transcript_9264/m.21746 type:complete len:253 (-) Transcript_9264:89-847(-)